MHIKGCSVFLGLFLFWGCSTHRYKISEGFVSFYLTHKDAKNVEFLCSIDDFRNHPATKTSAGTWEVRVPFNKEFVYFYKIDGKVFVPECELREKDDFGFENCLFNYDR